MPTTTKGDKILVSGANGFIGMWITRTLLERGYAVRGSVRSESKVTFLKEYFTSLGYGDQFETVIIEDITKEGAFDEAVKDVVGIAHSASPIHTNVTTANDFVDPAVKGTLGILTSALKNGQNIKRIVVTSSCAAVAAPTTVPRVFTEADWDKDAISQLPDKKDDKSSMSVWYRASKALAEQAAWDFLKIHKSEISWDMTIINPPLVFGPPIYDVASIEALNLSLHLLLGILTSKTPKTKEELLFTDSWVDVRDLSLAHALAFETPDAGGERIIISAGAFVWQEWIDAVNSISTNPFKNHQLYKGDPDVLKDKQYLIVYDTSKERRILGIKHHTILETAKDLLENISTRGW